MQPTPEEIEAFLASLGDDTMASDLQRQIDQARALRESTLGTPGFTTAGGVAVANPGQAIADMFIRGQGDAKEKAAQAAQAAMAEKQRKIAAEYFNKAFGTQSGSVPPQTGYGPQPFRDGGVI